MQLIAGNWKMNGLLSARAEVAALAKALRQKRPLPEIVVCPPATLLRALLPHIEGSPVKLGGQSCHAKVSGAHTGDISAEMLKDAGADFVIVGHSERRTDHKETSAEVAAQVLAAWRAGLHAIICIGESERERQEGRMEEVLKKQLEESVPKHATADIASIAYEPIWAIGTGKTASNDDIVNAHRFIAAQLRVGLGHNGKELRVLYGGSVKPSNAKEILHLEGVGGVLVGGASLRSSDFLAIIEGASLK